jgi:signal transduction histidine kinase
MFWAVINEPPGQRKEAIVTFLLRVLLLEDDPTDAELIQKVLEADNIACEVTRVQTRTDYLSGLEHPEISLILADYKLPSFDGLSALELAQSLRPDLPFIFVSGALGEEVAIEALKIGATDYVLKSRLSRLAPSVKRALREAGDRTQRKRAEDALRRSEMYLAEAQALSHTGSFGWDILSGEIYWSDETYRIFEIDPTTKPTVQMVLDRTHPDDRLYLRQIIERVALERRSFSAEHRLRTPNGSVKHVRVVARRAASGDLEDVLFVGAVMDITERKHAQEEHERLRHLEADLAHLNRLSIMGELAASLAHEIMQPIGSARNNARAAVNFLDRHPPDLGEVREALDCVVGDTDRAGNIIDRVRDHIKKAPPRKDRFDLNKTIDEVIVLARSAITKNAVSVETRFTEGLLSVHGDRVQLQQVVLNLILNAVEAMGSVEVRPRELLISTEQSPTNGVIVAVRDSGPGIDPEHVERVFEAFYTTKSSGVGIGLSICRSIIHAHGGRLSADANQPRGAVFQFTLPGAEGELTNPLQASHRT